MPTISNPPPVLCSFFLLFSFFQISQYAFPGYFDHRFWIWYYQERCFLKFIIHVQSIIKLDGSASVLCWLFSEFSFLFFLPGVHLYQHQLVMAFGGFYISGLLPSL